MVGAGAGVAATGAGGVVVGAAGAELAGGWIWMAGAS